MSSSLPQQSNLSNPFSTGSGGSNFETRIQAAFTVLLLTGQVSPCLPPWSIVKIKLQGSYDGFSTDDFIVFTKNSQSQYKAKLLAQIKHEISITQSDKTFPDVIKAAWNDFNDASIFNPVMDVLALITGPLSSTDTNHVRPILEWARHSQDEIDFLKKVNTPHFSSDEKREKLKVFKFHLKNANGGTDVSDKELWEFLKRFHLLGYDLDTEFGGTVSLILSLIAHYSTQDPLSLWTKIVDVVQTNNQNAGIISLENITNDIRDLFNPRQNLQWPRDLRKLKEHGEYIIDGIDDSVGGVHIDRRTVFAQLLDYIEKAKFVFISGERGCGKSSLLKKLYRCVKDRNPIFCFRAEDFDKSHLDGVFSSMGIDSSIGDIESGFALMPKKYLLIESIEKILELQNPTAFRDLLRFINRRADWVIIATGRDYAYQQIAFNYLMQASLSYPPLTIANFDDDEVKDLCEKQPILEPIVSNSSLKSLIKNPFFAELACRVVTAGTQFSEGDGEKEFIASVWNNVIAREQMRTNGMPLKREEIFIYIAVTRAKRMVYGIPRPNSHPEALLALEEDNLIRRDSSNGLVSLVHDVLEDLALERYIETTYQQNSEVVEFLDKVGHEPAMNRAFRLWLHQKLKYGENIQNVILSVVNNQEIQKCWKDEAISTILLSNEPYDFLKKLQNQLLDRGGELLKRFCFILRVSCKLPDNELSNKLGSVFLRPYGEGWSAITHFLLENKESISKPLVPHVIAVLEEWCSSASIETDLPINTAREAGLLALHLLSRVKNPYRDNDNNSKKLLKVIIKTVSAIKDEFNEFVNNIIFENSGERHRPSYVEDFCKMVLQIVETRFLCKYVPDTLIRLVFYEWLIDEPEEDDQSELHSIVEIEYHFGLQCKYEFFPASGVKGPFQSLLGFYPKKGLDFIISLVNFATEKYAFSNLDAPNRYSKSSLENRNVSAKQLEIQLDDGTVVKQYYSDRLWLAYRGLSVVPGLLQSALMALENWLISLAKYFGDQQIPEWHFNYILRNSRSVMTTAVLVSVATGFPDKFGKAVLPILRVPEFYDVDLIRASQETGINEPNWFMSQLEQEPFADVYMEERKTSALHSWRKRDLDDLVVCLQFSDLKQEVLGIVDELRSKVREDEDWRFRFSRIDTRNGKIVVDKEKKVVTFETQALEPDLQKKQQETQEQVALYDRFCKLYLWSRQSFNRGALDKEYYPSWKEAFADAKELLEVFKANNIADLSVIYYGGIVKAAAVFLRDYLNEMNKDELDWSIELTTAALEENSDIDNKERWIVDTTDRQGKTAASSIMPIWLGFAEDEEGEIMAKEIIVFGITHTNANVRLGIASGIREHLWLIAPEFAEKCFLAAIDYAHLQLELSNQRRQISQSDIWLENYEEIGDPIQQARSDFCQRFLNNYTSTTNIGNFDFTSHYSWFLSLPCLMVPNGSIQPNHIAFFSRMLTLLVNQEQQENLVTSQRRLDVDIDPGLSSVFIRRFGEHLFHLLQLENVNLFVEQLQVSCDLAPRLVHSLLLRIKTLGGEHEKRNLYWKLWGQLSGKVQTIAIGMGCDPESQNDKLVLIRGMLRYIHDTPGDIPDYEIEDIALGEKLIVEFVTNAGKNPDVFQAMASLMYRFPKIFFNSAIHILAKHQMEVGTTELFSRVNTTFYLEGAIERFLQEYETGALSAEMHQSCFILLDAMVETASSTAYYLREQLIRSRRKIL